MSNLDRQNNNDKLNKSQIIILIILAVITALLIIIAMIKISKKSDNNAVDADEIVISANDTVSESTSIDSDNNDDIIEHDTISEDTIKEIDVTPEEKEWIKTALEDYTVDDTDKQKLDINITLNGAQFKMPILGKELSELGWKSASDSDLISWVQSFGQVRRYEDTNDIIGVGYYNYSDNQISYEDAILSYIECDNDRLKINNIGKDDDLKTALEKLGIDLDNKNNYVEEVEVDADNHKWTISIVEKGHLYKNYSQAKTKFSTDKLDNILNGDYYAITYTIYGEEDTYSKLRIDYEYDNMDTLRRRYWLFSRTY